VSELLKIKEELKEFKKSVVNISYLYQRLPDSLNQIDCEELLDEIKYLRGYLDCMIEFNIDLLPEPKD